MHDSLTSTLSESAIERLAVMLGEVVASERLTAILVYSLKDLVSSGIPETREEGCELPAGGGRGVFLEDDSLEVCSVSDLYGLC